MNLGQISNQEVADHFRQLSYLKAIDLIWDRADSPLRRNTSKELFTAEALELLEEDYMANKRISKEVENHEEEEMIAKARREIALQL